jgi:hypothetical protein
MAELNVNQNINNSDEKAFSPVESLRRDFGSNERLTISEGKRIIQRMQTRKEKKSTKKKKKSKKQMKK